MPAYIIGPSDTKEHEQWSTELGQLLSIELDDFPLRLPVGAEELQTRLHPLVEAEVVLALAAAAKRRHLEREATLKFQLFLSRPGATGILSFSYHVDIDPFCLRCTACDGLLSPGSEAPR